MRLFKRILIVCGLSINHHAIRQAAALAHRNGAVLKFLQFSDPHFDHDSPTLGLFHAPSARIHRRLHRQIAFDLMPFIKTRKLRLQFNAAKENSQWAIKSELDRGHYDVVVVDGNHDNLMRSQMFNDLAMRLLRQCPLPLLISRSTADENRMRIMAAVGPLLRSDAFGMSSNALDDKVMALANRVALNTERRVHVLSCWQHPMEERMRSSSRLSDFQFRRFLAEVRGHQKNQLANFVKSAAHEKIRYRIHLRRGNPDHIIPQVALDHNIDLMVIGSFGRSGPDGLAFGNTAERVFCHSTLSLLVVKTSSFFSRYGNAITPQEAACQI